MFVTKTSRPWRDYMRGYASARGDRECVVAPVPLRALLDDLDDLLVELNKAQKDCIATKVELISAKAAVADQRAALNELSELRYTIEDRLPQYPALPIIDRLKILALDRESVESARAQRDLAKRDLNDAIDKIEALTAERDAAIQFLRVHMAVAVPACGGAISTDKTEAADIPCESCNELAGNVHENGRHRCARCGYSG